ncbi:ABC transporter substrate-binding protein [Evansella sp. AB-P1]|uniref:ABC transporter substrate-binding protein n=1 Tax=Evansella sp. AB-P1 TaxID=3037653 RepID=UPI00242034C0|nr:ABC transporter substrate-binding protein [Evansella sp. AB-P1]MDG5787929.1 ABC transporter substrate-binding protein [Evansella sp. AB-P1]
MIQKMSILLSVLVGLLVLVGCNESEGEGANGNNNNELEVLEATFILDWVPNTNHTGLYVAQEKGFFEEEGIDLTIIEPAMEGATQIVASGQAHFGIGAQDEVTVARSTGIPVVSIAAVIQELTSGFASPVEKGITSAADFEGKTYGGWGSPMEDAIIEAVMEASSADFSTLENVTVGTADFFVNTQRDIDFQWIYYGWTGIEAEIRNEEINMIYLRDIDPVFDYYAPAIITSDAVIEEQPELVERFLRAMSRGYEFAIDNPEEAAEILIGVTPETDADLIRASQDWLSERYQGDASQWGLQSESKWDNFTEWLLENGLIEETVNTSDSMTNQFLP